MIRVAVVNQEGEGGAAAVAREVLEWGPARGVEARCYPGHEGAGEEALSGALDAFRPHVLHLHCWYGSYPYDLPLRLQRRAKLLVTLHDPAVVNQYGEECWECYRNPFCLGCPALEPLRRWRPNYRVLDRLRKRSVNRRLEAFVAYPSAWLRRRVARSEWRFLPGEVVPNGVDVSFFAPGPSERARFGLPPGPLALFVGHMYSAEDTRKGLPDLFAAWPRVRKEVPGAFLAVAGSVLCDAPAGVKVLGDLPREELARLYRSADLLCLPSRGDNLPMTVIEGMASGLPVVATRVGGIPEQVRHEMTGLLVAARDVSALAAAVSALLGDATRRRAMGVRSLERARRLFSRERSARLYEALYRRLAR